MSSAHVDSTIASEPGSGKAALQALNAGALVVAALYFGQELLVPLVLASLLAFVLAPACSRLQRLRLPRVVAVIVVVACASAAIFGVGLVAGRQISLLAQNLQSYQAAVMQKWHAIETGGGLLQRIAEGLGPATGGMEISGEKGLDLARKLALPLLGPVATAGVVLIFTIFILLASEDLRDRLVRLVGRKDLHRTILAMNDAARRLSRYFAYQLVLNVGFGTVIGISIGVAGLPNPVLWGMLAAMMRFVPFIGTFIALVPPVLLAIVVSPDWTLAIVVAGVFIGLELLMGQVIEPLIYGHSTGLSPIAVIVATAFWALLWGTIGLLLATPLTVCLVVIGRHVEALSFLDVILGDTPPLERDETFYQRALEGNATGLLVGARQQIAATSLGEYYDQVALRGLALAQGDLARDALAFERLEAIHGQISVLLTHLEDHTEPAGTRPPPQAWQAPGAVVCIPGRGQLDDLAARMAVQMLGAAGLGAKLEPNLILGATGPEADPIETTDAAPVRLCCLSVLEDGSSASGIRYFVRRIQKRFPEAAVVVGLWHAKGDSTLLSALRSNGQDEHLVLSIGELVALTLALSARSPSAPARLAAETAWIRSV